MTHFETKQIMIENTLLLPFSKEYLGEIGKIPKTKVAPKRKERSREKAW